MRRVLHDEHDLFDEREPEQSRDVVLGTSALLGIFLAVALVCAVCFGFGYAQGHGLRGPLAAAPALVPQNRLLPHPLGGSGPETGPDTILSTAPEKPEPGAAPTGELPGMPPDEPSEVPAQARPGLGTTPRAAQHVPLVPPPAEDAADVLEGRNVPLEAPALTSAPAAAGLPKASLMVQIAAVSRAADAETLASALRHDGFAAAVRTSTADSLFHIQIGPFPSLAAAREMRGRLAGSGYNAFIKP